MNIQFVVYGDPVPKGRPRFFRKGKFVGTYTPKETEIAERDFKFQSIKHKPANLLAGAIVLDVKVFRKMPKSMSKKNRILAEIGSLRPVTKPDADNYAKLVCDAMNGIFWGDDSQIVKLTVEKLFSERPRIDVTLTNEEFLKEILHG